MKIDRSPLSAQELDFHQQLFASHLYDHGRLGCAVQPLELDLLVGLYKAIHPVRSLEWGLGSGISATALGRTRQSLGLSGKHVVLDPMQKEFDNMGIKFLEKFATQDCVEFIAMTSEEYLVQARTQGQSFDFVFIDGAHDLGHKLTDAFLTSGVLSPGGIVCFHDSFFTTTSLAITYLVEQCGMDLCETCVEASLRRRLRGVKHASSLGLRFATRYAPQIDFSLSVLQKRKT